MFFDTQLSASGAQACGTCHNPAFAYTASDGASVPLGGVHMNFPGFRNAPSLVYALYTPPFSLTGDGPVGGFFRDGRASSLEVQAEQPFVTAFEMANANAAEVLSRLQGRPYFSDFVQIYGQAAGQNADTALADMGLAIAAYEREDPSFHPFSSKFDYWLQGKATFTAQELRGVQLFNNPGKGNCTACHSSQPGPYNTHALFTDFTYDNIGVPRNWAIAANQVDPTSPVDGTPLTYIPSDPMVPGDADYAYYDLGLCGPFSSPANDPFPRPDLANSAPSCGQFKVPTLRNVAITAPYFHNGIFPNLRTVVEWYVTRDIAANAGNNPQSVTNPYEAAGTFYVNAQGQPDTNIYNDLPLEYDPNVNIVEVPYIPPTFLGGEAPTLTSAEINDVVAFLCTLTDGFDPAHPAAYPVPAQCAAVTSP
jgi:cytochrome c peroxidase